MNAMAAIKTNDQSISSRGHAQKSPFTIAGLLKIGSNQGLTRDGARYIVEAIRKGPSRAVSNDFKSNVTSIYPSVLMEETRQSESKTVERISLLRREFDPATFKFWMEQPEPIPVEGTDKNGKRRRDEYTGDILDIEHDQICITECKLKSELDWLVREYPKDWILDSTGYRYLPAEEAFSELGIIHRVEFPDCFAPIFAENVQLLLKASRSEPIPREASISKSVLRVLNERQVMRVDELMLSIFCRDSGPIYRLVASKKIATLIQECRLTFTNCAWVAIDEAHLNDIRRKLSQIQTVSPNVDVSTAYPTTKQIDRITRALDQLDGNAEVTVSQRTMRRWRAIINSDGPLGLKGKYVGKTGTLLSTKHEGLINSVLDNYYENVGSLSPRGAYKIYKSDFDKKKRKSKRRSYGRTAVCFETFRRRIALRNPAKLERARGGRRASRAAELPTPPEARSLPASRAFQSAHIDHCRLKLYVNVRQSNGQIHKSRVWLSFMVDEKEDFLMAAVITFDNPSRRTCARLLRDCIRRHGRLPESITTDQGADLRSKFMGEFMARKVIEHFLRPTAAGKWGKPVEAMFRQFLTVLDGIPGQMILGNIRSRNVSKSHKPNVIARLTLEGASELVDRFIDWYNRHLHGQKLVAPADAVARDLETFSFSGYPSKLDLDMLVLTSIPLSDKPAAVMRRGIRVKKKESQTKKLVTAKILTKGIHVQDDYYWHGDMAGLVGRRICDVRLDPEDDSYIWINVGQGWKAARSNEAVRRTAANAASVIAATVLRRESFENKREAVDARDIELGEIHKEFISPKSKSKKPTQKAAAPPKARKSRDTNTPKPSGLIFDRRRREVQASVVVIK